jgi:S1-C subfamily serine protease
MKTYRPLYFILAFVVIVGMACNLFTNGNTPTNNNTNTGNEPATSAPVESTPTSAVQSGIGVQAVSNLADAKKAVIQIESQGTFIDPQVGLVVNGAGRGSGFLIDQSGIAVTNNHVVTGSALLKVWVEGVQHNARILGVSECSDLAVIQVDGGGPFPYLDWYSDSVSTGLEVYAAGFPLGEPQFSLTKGIISKERADGQTSWASLDYVLGHDATINPGNSGGPLITTDGKVVGINYAGNQANQYFAIDEKIARSVVDQLIKGKDVDSIGINGTAVISDDKSFSGIWVSSVKSGSPADKAGVKPGDILYEMESLVLATDGTMKDYCSILRTHKPEDTLSLMVIRYSTGELLEGQLNGRELAVTRKFDVSGGGNSGGNSGGSSTGKDWFTESFDAPLSDTDWTVTLDGDNQKKATYGVENGQYKIDLEGSFTKVYVEYQPFTYTDVRIDVTTFNRGRNTGAVLLFCRATEEGWYQVQIANDGRYWIQAFDAKGVVSQGINLIANGGSKYIKSGREQNDYTFICQGDTLTLGINGVEERVIKDTKFHFLEGTLGYGLESVDSLPIISLFDNFAVSQP